MRDWLVSHDPDWHEALRMPGRRQDEPTDVYSLVESPWVSSEGYRAVWVRSLGKVERDQRTGLAASQRALPHRHPTGSSGRHLRRVGELTLGGAVSDGGEQVAPL